MMMSLSVLPGTRGLIVQIAIGERRAVVQDEFRFAFARGLDGLIKIKRSVISFQTLWSAKSPDRLSMRKSGLRQVQCILIVHRTF